MSETPANETTGATVPVTTEPTVPTTTPAVPAPADAATPPEKLTPRYVELARRERKIVESEKSLKDREVSAKRFEDARAKVKEDPTSALEALGIDLDGLIESALRKGKPETPEEAVKRIDRDRAEEKKAAETAKLTSEQAAVKQQIDAARASVRQFVTSKIDDYELVNAQDAHDEVFNVLSEHHEKTGELLPIEKAASMVEDFLFDRASTIAKSSKKIAAIFAPVVAPLPEKPKTAPAPVVVAKGKSYLVDGTNPKVAPKGFGPTLSNSLASPAAPSKAPPVHETSEQAAARIYEKHFKKKA